MPEDASAHDNAVSIDTSDDQSIADGTQVSEVTESGVEAEDIDRITLVSGVGSEDLGAAGFTANSGSDSIEFGSEAVVNPIDGTPLDDVLQGTGSDDSVDALAGDDIVLASTGSDAVDGNDGVDTVVYRDVRENFQHDLLQNGDVTVEKPGGDADTLQRVERIIFNDGELLYDIFSSNTAFGYRIYQASFARTPDEGGLRFWINVLDQLDQQGWTEYEKQQFLASQFIQSDEFRSLFGVDPTNEQYIDAMYLNVLFRLPDQGGYDFWVGGMENDGLTREDILIAFTVSDENVDNTRANLENGVWVVNQNDNAPDITSPSSQDVPENQADTNFTATADDAEGDFVTFAIVGGADGALFEIDAITGALSFIAPPDFEAPQDTDLDNTYEVEIEARDGPNASTQVVQIAVTNVNDTAPAFTSDPDVETPENQTDAGYQAAAPDADGDVVTFAIVGGADANLFSIDPATGVLSFLAPPEFDTPDDDDADNLYEVTIEASDGTLSTSQDVTITVTEVDTTPPVVVTAPSGVFGTAPTSLSVTYNESVSGSAFDVSGYALTNGNGAPVGITSVDRINDTTAQLNLASALPNGDFTLAIAETVEDLSGNGLAANTVANFSVDAATRVIAVAPSDETGLANIEREITIEFDRAIDPASITPATIKVMALGEAIAGRLEVSANEKLVTFFPDELLPASTKVRIEIDGDNITGRDGLPVDADNDGTEGGTLQTEFSTVSLSSVAGTNLQGFIFDSNNRAPDGSDLPLEGVIVTVVGRPDIRTVTDENGRFFLEDLPIPDVYIHFDATPVSAETGFQYGTIVKPGHTVAGQTITMKTPEGEPFNIYFSALSQGDKVTITPGQATEAGLGDFGLQNIAESFPDIDPTEFEKLKVIIPADSLTDQDGNPVEEVTIAAFEPDRIPAPLPQGVDADFVFTVAAGDATNVNGKAQVELPNLDNLPPGTKRPIYSFDHDAGKWVITGTGIVSEDGTKIVSEGDSGVNTLGWKFVGESSSKPINQVVTPTRPKQKSWDEMVGTFEQFYSDRAGTAGAPYARQLLEIAKANADQPWAQGVVKESFEKIASDVEAGRNQYDPDAILTNIPSLPVLNDFTAVIDGYRHFQNELSPEFWRLRDRMDEDLDDNGIRDHTEFLNTIPGAFGQVGANGELSPLAVGAAATIIPNVAALEREIQQAKGVIYDGITNGAEFIGDLFDGSDELNFVSNYDFISKSEINSYQFFSDQINSVSEFQIRTISGDLFSVGDELELISEKDGQLIENVEYFASTSRGFYEIEDNLLKIEKSDNIISDFYFPQLIYAVSDGLVGVFQFGILDSDLDQDGLNDSFERDLDPSFLGIDNRLSDIDNDGVTDFSELLHRSDWLLSDTDGDGVDDLSEARLKSNLTRLQERAEISDEFYWRLENVQSGTVFSGKSLNGKLQTPALAPTQIFKLSVIDRGLNSISESIFEVPETSSGNILPELVFTTDPTIDGDNDTLSLFSEFVLGLNDSNPDTDGDGILDGAELDQGLNPLDGLGFPTGVIAAVNLPGEALDVAVVGSLTDSAGQTAFLATGHHGLVIVDASQFDNPIVLGQIDLPGENVQVAANAAASRALVAAGAEGLHIVDVSDPLMPVLTGTLAEIGSVNSVLSQNGVAIVGGDRLSVIFAETGDVIFTEDIPGEVVSMALDGDTLYAVIDNRQLVSYLFSGNAFVELDRETIPTPPIRRKHFEDFQIFVDDGVARISNGLDLKDVALFRPLERGGYVTFDVSDPNSLSLISNIDTPEVQAANLETVTNGSGLAVVAAGQRGVQIHGAADPSVTYDLITEFDTDGNAQGVFLAGGIAYVADGFGGLKVVNFLPFDPNGVAPAITIDSETIDADPVAPGQQIEEGDTINLSALITDDVQVRNVELLINGQVVRNDVSAPYDLSFVVPPIDNGNTSISVQMRATDTGGNVALSNGLDFEVIEDITAPSILSISPLQNALVLADRVVLTVTFDESMDRSTITASGAILRPVGGGDPIFANDVVFLADDNVVSFSFEQAPYGDYELSIELNGVTDRAGNPLPNSLVTRQVELAEVTTIWEDPFGGDWFNVSDWSENRLPTTDDIALVTTNGNATVFIDGFFDEQENVQKRFVELTGLRVNADLDLYFAELDVGFMDLSPVHTFRLETGTLKNALLRGEGDYVLVEGILSNVAISSESSAKLMPFSNEVVQIEDGLTVNGILDLTDPSGTQLDVLGSGETIDGAGEILLDDGTIRYRGEGNGVAEILTFGDNLTLRGQGAIRRTDGPDSIRILGNVVAEGGTLTIANLEEFSGHARASSDGNLVVQSDFVLDDFAGLTIGFDGAGGGQDIGSIAVLGELTRNGSLALDISDEFANDLILGDEFTIVTTTQGVFGSFDSFQGFDLAGDMAFGLFESAGDLIVRVVTDAEAQPFIGGLNGLQSAQAVSEAIDFNASLSYRLYQTSFGRAPDEDGLRHWVDVLDSLDEQGWTVADKQEFLAEQFLNSSEFQNHYGSNLNHVAYVDALYQNMLSRGPDPEGQEFWVRGLEQGLSEAQVLIAFSQSDEVGDIGNLVRNDDDFWIV